MKKILSDFPVKDAVLMTLGAAIVAFGLYNIHEVADITEGGLLGLELLLEHWFSLSPAVTNLVLSAVCFFLGWRALGRGFILRSAFSIGMFSLCYALVEKTPRLLPGIAEHPLLAAVLGAMCIGVGAGLSIRGGGAQCGDDALAMALREFRGWRISSVYLASDVIILFLSLTYIPPRRILYSLLTVVLSGQTVELVQRPQKEKRKASSCRQL